MFSHISFVQFPPGMDAETTKSQSKTWNISVPSATLMRKHTPKGFSFPIQFCTKWFREILLATHPKNKALNISRLALPCNPEVRSGIATTAKGCDLLITSRSLELACPRCMGWRHSTSEEEKKQNQEEAHAEITHPCAYREKYRFPRVNKEVSIVLRSRVGCMLC